MSFALPHMLKRQDGQTMTEFALTLAAIVLVGVAAIGLLSAAIVTRFGDVASTIKGLVP